jgi:4'-phosphopantetheinyl transferase
VAREAGALRFSTGPQGKPALVDGGPLRFNLAHTDGVVLVAVSARAEIGVDVERVTDTPVDDAMLEVAMASDERAALRAISDGEARRRAFFATWARREAVLKALGVGLSLPVDELAVSVGPAARIERGGGGLVLVDLPVGDELAAARLYRFSFRA